MSEWVTLTTSRGSDLSAYVARPAGEVLGGLVLVQEIFGVNASIRKAADGFAEQGFVTVAPALFDRFEKGVELSYTPEDMERAFALMQMLKPETTLEDVGAAFAYAGKESGKGVAVAGYCYGGFTAWIAATRGATVGMEPVCTIGFYAGGIGKVASEEPSCPVVLHFGAEDSHISQDQVNAVRVAHPEVTIYMYPGSGHGFANPDRDSYTPENAKLATARSVQFLKAHLG